MIAGTARGHRLGSVAGRNTRPTSDRVKESLFAIIGERVNGAEFLDLFAGNGGIGIEALSRGAANAVFVDKDRRCGQMIKQNLQTTKLCGEVYVTDVGRAIEKLGRQGRTFDIVYVDPPYGQGLLQPSCAGIVNNRILRPGGIIVLEYGRREEIAPSMWKIEEERVASYGDTTLAFWAHKEDVGED